jgi:hypothetical protein
LPDRKSIVQPWALVRNSQLFDTPFCNAGIAASTVIFTNEIGIKLTPPHPQRESDFLLL